MEDNEEKVAGLVGDVFSREEEREALLLEWGLCNWDCWYERSQLRDRCWGVWDLDRMSLQLVLTGSDIV